MLNDKPVAFASKSLTKKEINYTNIECEMLAEVFGYERFHNYLFGGKLLVCLVTTL